MDLNLEEIVAIVAGGLGAGVGAALLIQWRTHRARVATATWPGTLTSPTPWQRTVAQIVAAALLGAAAFWPGAALTPSAGNDAVVVFAIDVSRSMNARDVVPSRLSAALEAMRRLARQIRGPIGVTAFAGESIGLAPFTTDRGAIELALDEVRRAAPQVVGGSTPANAIGAALDLLERSQRRGAIVLSSDGEWTSDEGLDASLLRAATASVPIYALGFGSAEGVSMSSVRETDAAGDAPVVETRITKLDAASLRILAERTNGQSWTLSTSEVPAALIASLQTPAATDDLPGEWLHRLFWMTAFVLLVGSGFSWRGTWLPRAQDVATRMGAALLIASTSVSCTHRGELLRGGNQAFDRGNDDEALARYREAVAKRELADRAWFNSGLAFQRGGQLSQSIDAFTRSAAAADDDRVRAQAHFNRGNVLAGRDQLDVAEKAFVDALRADPDFEAARINLAIVRERLRSPQSPQPPPPPIQPPPRYAFPRRPDENRKPRVASDW